MRREWIEMKFMHRRNISHGSPSMRREWIEINLEGFFYVLFSSPSMRREWIEILWCAEFRNL